jgi:hypothetical protein
VVVAVGLTIVDPVADVDVNVPGVIAILAAPAVVQLSVLLEPEAMLVGLGENELMVGFPGVLPLMVTVAVDVAGPVAFVAVSM